MKNLTFSVLAMGMVMSLNAQVCFTPEPAQYYQYGLSHSDVKAADMNGDGEQDLVFSNYYGNSVTVLKNTGALLPSGLPQFTPITVSAGQRPFRLYVNDFDGDGDKDIAVTNQQSGTVTVYLNDGNIGMTSTEYTVGASPSGIVGGDFNGDGNLDLAVANRGEKTIRFLNGIGGGQFVPAATFYDISENNGYTPEDLAAGYFDDVQGMDLVVSVVQGTNAYYRFLYNNGTGFALSARTSLNVSTDGGSQTYASTVDTADFNNDGKADIVFNLPYYTGQKIAILKAPNWTPYQTALNNAPSNIGYDIACADYNGDGNTDIAVIQGGSIDSVKILLGNGGGDMSFPLRRSFRGQNSNSPRGLVAVDLTHDGKLDLATANLIPSSAYYDVYAWRNVTPFFDIVGDRDFCAPAPQTVNLTAQSPNNLSYTWTAGATTSNGSSFTVTVNNPTTYFSVSAFDAILGCTNTSLGIISIHPLPIVHITGPPSVCNGTSLTLTATGNATNWTWHPANVTSGQAFTPDTTALYTLTGSKWYGALECMATDTHTVFVKDMPTVFVTVNGDTAQGTFTPPNAALQWLDCDNNNAPIAGTTQSSFTPAQSGRYALRVTSQGCEAVSDCVSIPIYAAIDEWHIATANIFPNPNNGTFTIDLGNLSQKYNSLSVIDIYGRLVQTIPIAGEKKNIQVSLDLAAGVYFLRLNGTKNITQRIIIY